MNKLNTAIVLLVLLIVLIACSGQSVSEPPVYPTPDHTAQPQHTPAGEILHTPVANLPPGEGWPIFHRDEFHTGLSSGKGNIDPSSGPRVWAKFKVFDQPGELDLTYVRWTSTLPLADLDGDGTLEIVVTTPAVAKPVSLQINGEPLRDQVMALKIDPSTGALGLMWTNVSPLEPGSAGLDTYSPALADADGDGLPDVIYTSRDGFVRALSGLSGELIWEFDTGRLMESGPLLADLDEDGSLEAIVTTDCTGNNVYCPDKGKGAMLFVLPVRSNGRTNQPLWSLEYPYKMDSAVPVVANIGEGRKVLILGTWGGELLAAWQGGTAALKLSTLDPSMPSTNTPVIRVSPLFHDFGDGPTVIFGWLPTDENVQDARLSSIGLSAAANGGVEFTPRWTLPDYDVWKSSPALLPIEEGSPWMVMGYGLGIGPAPSQSGAVGQCQREYVFGGVVALNGSGQTMWVHDYGKDEGNLRASAAVADMDGDGILDVIIPSGCFGKLHALNGLNGEEEWSLQLGPISQGSPSLGDLDGDGNLEIVLSSYDGNVWVLGSN
jgi:outer membrane protein assembly factor BamB